MYRLSVVLSCVYPERLSFREQAPGVVDAEINSQGELVLIYQDGTQQNLGVVVGKDGSNGEDGKDGKDGENATLVTEGLEHAVSSASAKGLLSAVSIVCNFKYQR